MLFFFFFKQKTAYEMRISDWSSDVCSSDLSGGAAKAKRQLSPSWRRSTTVPTPSTWPETMWPPSSSPSFSGRSKLTAWPARQPPMVVQARVSFETSTANQPGPLSRSEEHTSELQSLMRISYAVFCLKKKKTTQTPP